jgi:hypothetical protein
MLLKPSNSLEICQVSFALQVPLVVRSAATILYTSNVYG